MANNERLTKRVKIIEDWVAGNEEMGGPKGYMDTMVSMYQSNVGLGQKVQAQEQQFGMLRGTLFDFLKEQDLTAEWDDYIKEKENVVPEQEETESGEEADKAPKEEIKD